MRDDFGTYQQARHVADEKRFDGVGFLICDGVVGIDFDWKGLGQGIPAPVRRFLDWIGSYAEVTPSGEGCHVLILGTMPGPARSKIVGFWPGVDMEIYDHARYFTYTGRRLNAHDLTHQQAKLEQLYQKHLKQDRPVVELAAPSEARHSDAQLLVAARRQPRFVELFEDTGEGGDHSQLDFSLCLQLAFWTGGCSEQMDRLFRESGLYRQKWDQRRGRHTYGELTIMRALDRWMNNGAVSYSGKASGAVSAAHLATLSQNAQQTIASSSLHGRTRAALISRYGWILDRMQRGFVSYDPEVGVYEVSTGGIEHLSQVCGGRTSANRALLGQLAALGLIELVAGPALAIRVPTPHPSPSTPVYYLPDFIDTLSTQNRILAFLRAGRSIAALIAQALGVSRTTVYHHLTQLERRGQIRKDAGAWTLVDEQASRAWVREQREQIMERRAASLLERNLQRLRWHERRALWCLNTVGRNEKYRWHVACMAGLEVLLTRLQTPGTLVLNALMGERSAA